MTGITTSNMNLDLQAHIEKVTTEGTVNTFTGLAWSRGNAMEKIEYSIDDGETWSEVMYESVDGSVSIYGSFEFMFKLDSANLPQGENMVMIRAVDSDGSSSMISWKSIEGSGEVESMSSSSSFGRIAFISVVGFVILIFGAWVALGQNNEEEVFVTKAEDSEVFTENHEPMVAELIEDEDSDPSS